MFLRRLTHREARRAALGCRCRTSRPHSDAYPPINRGSRKQQSHRRRRVAFLKKGLSTKKPFPRRPDVLQAASGTVSRPDQTQDAHQCWVSCFREAAGNRRATVNQKPARIGYIILLLYINLE